MDAAHRPRVHGLLSGSLVIRSMEEHNSERDKYITDMTKIDDNNNAMFGECKFK